MGRCHSEASKPCIRQSPGQSFVLNTHSKRRQKSRLLFPKTLRTMRNKIGQPYMEWACKLYSSSLVSSSGAPRRSDLRWESFNAGTICSLSIDDLFNNLFSNVFNNLFQNSQSVEILKQSRYVGADGKKDKFFLHSHDYHMATGLPENSHILELSNRLLNTLLNRY